MILLKKLDNSSIILNLETVKYIESVPDTVVNFTNGDSIIVKESLEQIIQQSVQLKSQIIAHAHKAESFTESNVKKTSEAT